MSKIHILHGVGLDNEPITLPDHLPELREKIEETGARLLIVDPLGACLSSKVDSYVDASVRRALAPLAQLAAETECAVLIVRHLVKAPSTRALHAGGGSVGITGAARLVLAIGPAPDNADDRVLAVVKCNIRELAPSLRYRIASCSVPAEGGPVSAPRIEWLGTTKVSADDLIVARNEPTEERGQREEARSWLESELANGERLIREVMRDAETAGFSARTLQRAGRDLGVRRHRPTLTGPWVMALPTITKLAFSPTPSVLATHANTETLGENEAIGENTTAADERTPIATQPYEYEPVSAEELVSSTAGESACQGQSPEAA